MLDELAPGDLRPAFAMAYGSGVFAQAGATAGGSSSSTRSSTSSDSGTKGKMVDLVLAVQDPVSWHRAMMARRPGDYSALARWSPRSVLAYAQGAGAGVWYNPYVVLGGQEAKYGVVSVGGLLADLREWTTLYVSGRMHKPVATVVPSAAVAAAQAANRRAALRAALLLLPPRFAFDALLAAIVGLSYTGDWRMDVPGGENAHKVRNIVHAQRDDLAAMYLPLLAQLAPPPGAALAAAPAGPISASADVGTGSGSCAGGDAVWEQDCDPVVRGRMASLLPRHLAARVAAHYGAPSLPAPAAFWERVAADPQCAALLRRQIGTIVRQPARAQSVKGVYTAGVGRSARYVRAKMGKYSDGRKVSD